MVLINELWDQSEANIEQILSSLKQDLPELEQQILETFHQMRESLQPVLHLFDGLDLDRIPKSASSQELLQWLFKNSQGSKEAGELMEAASSNNELELPVQQAIYECQGVVLPSRLKQMETIWEWLNNDRVGTIGITGESGIGKTWMVMQLKDRAIKAKLFDIVIVLDMSRTSYFLETQQYIVDQLGLSITRKTDEKHYNEKDLNRVVTLSLGKKKCLLIVDDIKFGVDQSKLGFSEPWKQNVSSKVLLSGPTYLMDRIEMDKICRVEPLDDDEALLLFLGQTGLDIDSPNVIEIVQPLVPSFEGIPSEIVWLRGSVVELTNGVCHLLNSGKMEVIQCLRSCCYVSGEDRNMKVKDLIAWWIMEILVDDCLGLEEAYEKAQHILHELIDSQFLEGNETHVWLRTELVSHLELDSFISNIIPPPEFKKERSSVMNEKFRSKDSDDDVTELLLMYGKESYLPRYIPADFFIQKMQKLNTLAILNAGIVSLPESLSNLKHLELLIIKGCTSLENLDSIRGLQKLKRLCISGASKLREIPDDIFENIDKLVELDLSNTQLKQLPFSFSNLENIKTLNLRGCSRLESIPSMEAFHELSLLDLSGASSLTSIPDTSYSIITLDLSGTLIDSLPTASNLGNLVQLFLRGCTKITTVPHPDGYQSLEVVDLTGSTSFREFRGQALTFKGYQLSKLDLSGTRIAQVPPFVRFVYITKLLLRNCVHLETMPHLDFKLEVIDLSGSIAFKNFQDAPLPDQLKELDLSRTQIGKLPVLSMHSSIVHLILRECGLLEELPHLDLQRLQVLDLSGSTKFKTFKDHSFNKLRNLKTLNLSETQVRNLPKLSHCKELQHLIMRKCLKLEELPHLNTLEKLELFDLSGAISFKQFQDESFGKKEELHELNLSETRVANIPSLSECHNLRKLLLGGCSKLEILPKMEVLSRLIVLDLSGISLIKFHIQSTGLKYDYLQELDLSGTEISDLKFMSGCIALRRLSLKDCPNILTMPPLDELTRLEELDLSRTEITEFSFLFGCKSLRQLLLNDCLNIQELTSLKEHTRLEVLDLSGMKAEDFSLLSGFNELRELSLRGCNLDTLPFEGLHILKKVDLSYNPIKVLPTSFSELQNLQTLLLADCSSLETLPHMEFLPKLEVLDLSCTNVREFPSGISTLTHLRFLKLQVENSLWEFHNGKSLEKFHFCLFAPKEKLGENDIYLQGQQYSFKNIYYQTSHIPSIAEEPGKFFKICGFQTFPAGIEEVLPHVELLYLKKNNFLTRLSDLGAENVKNMRECWIENCDMETVYYGEEVDEFAAVRRLFSMENVFYGEEVDEIVDEENVAFGRCLQNLWVSKLPELKSLFGGVVQPGSFTLLKHLYIECCPSLITVFSYHLKLKNLEVLKIKFCDKIEGIYGENVLGEKTLPKLKTLILLKLPKLQSICGGVLPSLKNLRVIGCSKIKRLPVSRKTTSPVKIKGEAVWWNNLEWEDEGTKSQQRFSPF